MFRHGDLLIVVSEVPDGAKRVRRKSGRLVLAEGEVTGHAHTVSDKGAEMYHDPATEAQFLRVLDEGGVALTHQEHDTLTLPPGDYEIRHQQEYSPEEVRQVAD